MKKHGRLVAVVLVLATLLSLVGGWAVFAQSPTATPVARPTPKAGEQPPGFPQRGGERLDKVALEAAAKVLGMTADDLSNQLWGGSTLAALAEQKGVDLQQVRDAVSAAHKAQTKTAIEQAVTEGTMTREKADWLLTGLEKGFWGGQGDRGMLGGPGGFGGRGGRLGR